MNTPEYAVPQGGVRQTDSNDDHTFVVKDWRLLPQWLGQCRIRFKCKPSILRLSQAGVQMFPDEDLEDYVRDAAGLPDAQEDRPWEAQLQMQAGDQAKKQSAKSPASHLSRC